METIYRCNKCGAEFLDKTKEGKHYVKGNDNYYFCSDACYAERKKHIR
jgi:hypothetical protein